MKVAALFSGGKDSTYAIYLAQQRGWSVTKLVTLVPGSSESYMFHVPNIHLAPMLAEAMSIELVTRNTSGEKEKELDDLKDALSDLEVDGVLTGAIASDYQATRIDRICYELGLVCYSQLWRWDQSMTLQHMVDSGFRIMVVGVYGEGLDRDWLGRILDDEAIGELLRISARHRINVSGEGGEMETLVVDGPNFKKEVVIENAGTDWQGSYGEYRIEQAALRDKAPFKAPMST